MHKQRIINGIEDVFRSYMYDEELRKALNVSHKRLELFGHGGVGYFLTPDREVLMLRNYGEHFSSPKEAAQAYFEHFRLRCKPPVTLTKAKAKLAEDLGARVEQLKKDYAQNFDRKCDRQAESRYVQHPNA